MPTSSSSVSGGSVSGWMSLDSKSSVGVPRFCRTCPCGNRRSSSSAAGRSSTETSRLTNWSARTWNSSRSSWATPSNSQIARDATGTAKSRTRSAVVPPASISSSREVTIPRIRSSSRRIRGRVKCLVSGLRYRVWAGGSMAMKLPASAFSFMSCSRSSSGSFATSGLRIRSALSRGSLSSLRLSSYPVTSQPMPPSVRSIRCTSACSRYSLSMAGGSNGQAPRSVNPGGKGSWYSAPVSSGGGVDSGVGVGVLIGGLVLGGARAPAAVDRRYLCGGAVS